ncbi:MAG TPA: type II toxin-antitoxin system RelE/ParE family toxin [bacterium]|nr:type II toxin-antitoxin system RelE/ParE family toxin [bacterium]
MQIIMLAPAMDALAVLPANIRERIRRAMEHRLSDHPEMCGEALAGTLRGYWRIRVGDYRVIYRISGQQVIVHVIGNRKDVYGR